MTTPNPRMPASTPLLREVAGLGLLVTGAVGALTLLFVASPLVGGAALCALVAYGGYLLGTSEV